MALPTTIAQLDKLGKLGKPERVATEAWTLRVSPSLARKLIASLELAHLDDLIEVVMVGAGDELTPAEVAAILGVSASTVRRYERKGWLVPRRLAGSGYRRYKRTAVEEFKRRDEAGEFAPAASAEPTTPDGADSPASAPAPPGPPGPSE